MLLTEHKTIFSGVYDFDVSILDAITRVNIVIYADGSINGTYTPLITLLPKEVGEITVLIYKIFYEWLFTKINLPAILEKNHPQVMDSSTDTTYLYADILYAVSVLENEVGNLTDIFRSLFITDCVYFKTPKELIDSVKHTVNEYIKMTTGTLNKVKDTEMANEEGIHTNKVDHIDERDPQDE